MTKVVRTIIDPFNNTVHLIEGVCASSFDHDAVYDDASMVIEKPAICVEWNSNESRSLFYFRSIDWHTTMLITVQFLNNRWETSGCEKNPSNKTLSEILKKGKQLK